MKETIEKFEKEEKQLMARLDVIRKAKMALQEACEHKESDGKEAWLFDGHDSHKRHYTCGICKAYMSV